MANPPPTSGAEDEPVHAPGTITCPRCGHHLSLYMEPADSRASKAAGRLADAMGSWRFLVVLCLVTVVYISVTITMRPSGTDTAIVLNYLGIGMTTLVAIQTPLILLTQRRDAASDRARDREALRVATHAERDLHAIRTALHEGDAEPATRSSAPEEPAET